jgi:AraC-like DNA-binding protein
MARPRKEPAAASSLVPPLVRYVRAQGGLVEALSARFGLPDDVEARDEVLIAPSDLGQLLEVAAGLLGDPFLGIHLPGALQHERYGLAELAARASPTLQEALERRVRYGALVDPQAAFQLEMRDGLGCFTHRLVGYPRGVGRQAHEYALASPLAEARALTGVRLEPARVWFIHARPRDLEPLEAFFGTGELDFGRTENGMALAPELLRAPLPTHDARLLATAEHLADRELRGRPSTLDFTAQVAARIREALPEGDSGARAVARALHMSSRTLQRRLEEEGTRFSEVFDGVREELARRYVADPALPLGEIAFRLGFSDFGTFSRAFKRWTGSAPGVYRRSG